MARLHNHADSWSPPDGFVRIRWDGRRSSGDTMEYGGINAANVWTCSPPIYGEMFDEVASRAGTRMDQLGTEAETFGLIHADLHLDNTLFRPEKLVSSTSTDWGSGIACMDVAVALGSCDNAATTAPSATLGRRDTRAPRAGGRARCRSRSVHRRRGGRVRALVAAPRR